MEFVIGILGAGIGAGLMSIIQAALQRKWKKEDARMAKHGVAGEIPVHRG